jgi:hypothetical protein
LGFGLLVMKCRTICKNIWFPSNINDWVVNKTRCTIQQK